jgi:hypothetical protein
MEEKIKSFGTFPKLFSLLLLRHKKAKGQGEFLVFMTPRQALHIHLDRLLLHHFHSLVEKGAFREVVGKDEILFLIFDVRDVLIIWIN